MAFNKRTITDRTVEFARRFQLTPVVGQTDTYDLQPIPGTIVEPGTAINSLYLQPIEDALVAIPVFQTAGGTATAITVDTNLIDGYSVTFIVKFNNNGSATTINGLPLYKPGTTTAPNLTLGKAVTVWYNTSGNSFFIKASAEGNAVVADVLASKTFSNDDDTGLVGTMPNNGTVVVSPDDSGTILSAGYYASITVQARPTLTGTATTGQVLSGVTFYSSSYTKLTGTIPSKTAQTFTPSTANQTITAGQYLSGTQTISGDADLISTNIKSGANIFGVAGNANVVDTSGGNLTNPAYLLTGYTAYSDGVQRVGTMPNRGGAVTVTPSTVNQTKSAGYYSGNITIAGDADLVAGNIKSGVNIFNVPGTLVDANSAKFLLGNFGVLYTNKGPYSNDLTISDGGNIAILTQTSGSSIYKKTFNSAGTIISNTLWYTTASGVGKFMVCSRNGVVYIKSSTSEYVGSEVSFSGTILGNYTAGSSYSYPNIRLKNGALIAIENGGAYLYSGATLLASASHTYLETMNSDATVFQSADSLLVYNRFAYNVVINVTTTTVSINSGYVLNSFPSLLASYNRYS